MSAQNVKLIDNARNVLATAQVAVKKDYYGGTIDLRGVPAGLRALFDDAGSWLRAFGKNEPFAMGGLSVKWGPSP